MKKGEMRSYAVIGVHARLLDVERELRDLYKLFPEAFVTPPGPLARPELKNGHSSNGHGLPPIVVERTKPKRTPPSKSKAYHGKTATLNRRRETAALLDRAEKAGKPLPASTFNGRASVLIQRGYLKHSGDGLVRTAKPFSVER